jgi:dipeptidyl aminopeptidase/acylaminoacyl peptidase
VPWLVVHGGDDDAVALTEGELLAAAGGENVRFMSVPGAGHTFGAAHPWRGATVELEQVLHTTLAFFASELH